MSDNDNDFNIHDEALAAKLTAYALGELPEEDRAEIEALIESDAAARAHVEGMRGLDSVLGEHLGAETATGLSSEQKQRIESAARAGGEGAVLSGPKTFIPALAAAAALVAAVALLASQNRHGLEMAGGQDVTYEPAGVGADRGGYQTLDDQAAGRDKHVRELGKGGLEAEKGPATGDGAGDGGEYRGPHGEHPPPKTTDAPAATDGPADGATMPPPRRDRDPGRTVGKPTKPAPSPPPPRPGSDPPPPPDSRAPQTPGGDGNGPPVPSTKSGDRRRDGGVAFERKPVEELDVEETASERLRRSSRTPPTAKTSSGEAYEHPGEAHFRDPWNEPLSTFSIDVDTASYANVRRMLNASKLPPPAAVRIEEMVNYFDYDYPKPEGDRPLGVGVEVAGCPWNVNNRLVRVGLRARDVGEEPGPANLVFLIDVSGSMRASNKLPLLRSGLRMMLGRMTEDDRVAIVCYASNSGVRLPSTNGAEKDTIRRVIDGLKAGGSTNGGAGIQQAYAMAEQHFVKGGVNRVILATDGDFNVGVTDRGQLVRLIQEKAKGGVFLSVLGLGTGNLKDATLEQLADKGNGNYNYLDGLQECRKVLVDEMRSTLVTVAKDVKVQVEFNPHVVREYRLVGYENRMLAARDFNDDTKDAGEMGAGHTVTALYEVVPADAPRAAGVDPLKYQPEPEQPAEKRERKVSGEMLTVKVRYKLPDATESARFDMPVTDGKTRYAAASSDFKFAAAVAAFGHLLRRSPSAGNTSFDAVIELAGEALGEDEKRYRTEFLDLVRKAKELFGGRHRR